jgi:CheY-like chemotaxis protein
VDTVLIVDDSVMLINYLQDFFKRYEDKFDFITANDGLEAIEILKNKTISLLVTDLEMPKIDGLRLLAYTNEYHPNIPCIIMSAHGTPKIIETLQPDIIQREAVYSRRACPGHHVSFEARSCERVFVRDLNCQLFDDDSTGTENMPL